MTAGNVNEVYSLNAKTYTCNISVFNVNFWNQQYFVCV